MSLKALIAVAALTISPSALACSCERSPTAAGILARASVVFTGIARRSVTAGQDNAVTTFEITEHFKGPQAKTIAVRHPSGSSASCGVQFKDVEINTLAAHDGAGGLTTTLCSTWMFMPQVGMRDKLIGDMRAQRTPPRR